jgi:hypothetical protein
MHKMGIEYDVPPKEQQIITPYIVLMMQGGIAD